MDCARNAPRADLMTQVAVSFGTSHDAALLWGSNISETGMFVQTTKPWKLGDRLCLRFELDDGAVEVNEAEVVWIRPFEPIMVDGHLPGCGLEFVSVDHEDQGAIRRFVERKLAPRSEEAEQTFLSIPVRPFDGDEHPLADWRLEVMPRPTDDLDETVGLADLHTPAKVEPTAPTARPRSAIFDESAWSALDDALEDDPAFAVSFSEAVAEATRSLERELDSDAESMTTDEDSAARLASEPTLVRERGDDDKTQVESLPYGLAVHGAEIFDDDEDEDAGDAFEESEPHVFLLMNRKAEREHHEHANNGDKSDWKIDVEDSVKEVVPDPEPSVGHRFFAAGETETETESDDDWSINAHEASSFVASRKHGARPTPLAFDDEEGGVLPIPAEDLRAIKNRPSPRLLWASAFLLAGAAGGVLVALDGAEPTANKTSAVVASADAVGAIPSIAELERPLHEATPPAARALVDAPAAAAEAGAEGDLLPSRAPADVANTKVVTLSPTPQKPVAPAPVKPELNAKTSPIVETKAESKAIEPQVLTSGVIAEVREAKPAALPSGLTVDEGNVSIALDGGEVARAFALTSPARVVVDLKGTRYPGFKEAEINDKGVARIRVGRPDPEHVRVVIELSRAEAPEGISTLKRTSTLSLSWR